MHLIIISLSVILLFFFHRHYILEDLKYMSATSVCLQKLSLAPGSLILNLWLEPPVRIYVKIYLFNVANPTEFLSGKEKLRVEELGPFVYEYVSSETCREMKKITHFALYCREHLTNTNPVFNENGTLTYIPKRTVKFVPEMSVSNPKLQAVTVPNIPYLVRRSL